MTFEILIIIWLAAAGAAVGSFLNVVIYRLPRGESLVSPPSHCPKCNHRIRWYDNIPIFGWFLLGGKCRDCKQPISFRYPLIETIACVMVTTFALLLFPVDLQFVHPVKEAKPLLSVSDTCYIDSDENVVDDNTPRIDTWVFRPMTFNQTIVRILWLSMLHLLLLTVGMIEFDREPFSVQSFSKMAIWPLGISFTLIGMAGFNFVYPVPCFSIWPFETLQNAYSHSIYVDSTWYVCPLFFLISIPILTSIFRIKFNDNYVIAVFFVILFLGWQMAVMILLLTAILNGTVYFVVRRSLPILSLTAASFLVNICVTH